MGGNELSEGAEQPQLTSTNTRAITLLREPSLRVCARSLEVCEEHVAAELAERHASLETRNSRIPRTRLDSGLAGCQVED